MKDCGIHNSLGSWIIKVYIINSEISKHYSLKHSYIMNDNDDYYCMFIHNGTAKYTLTLKCVYEW